MSNNSQDNLLEALGKYVYVAPTVEYRVFYNTDTYECVSKSCDGGNGIHVTVDKEQYDLIEFCQWYYVKDGKIVKKKVVSSMSRLLSRSNSKTEYAAVKDNNIFVVDDECFSGAIDYWGVRGWDE
jgi:hypothetical protein